MMKTRKLPLICVNRPTHRIQILSDGPRMDLSCPGYKPGPCSAFSCHVPLLSSHQGQLLNLCHSWPWHFEKNVSPLGFVWCPLVWIQVFMFGRCYPDEVCLSAVHLEAHSIDVSYYCDHLGDSSFQTLPMKQLTKMSWDFTELLCV